MKNFSQYHTRQIAALAILLGVDGNTVDPDDWNEMFERLDRYFERGGTIYEMLDTYATDDGEVGVRLSEDFKSFCKDVDAERQFERQMQWIEDFLENTSTIL